MKEIDEIVRKVSKPKYEKKIPNEKGETELNALGEKVLKKLITEMVDREFKEITEKIIDENEGYV